MLQLRGEFTDFLKSADFLPMKFMQPQQAEQLTRF